MSEYYTHTNFKLFQEELMSCCIDYETKIVRDEDPHKVFQVSESEKSGRGREVLTTHQAILHGVDAQDLSNDIPCHYVLVVMRSCHVNELPSHYLLSRWVKKRNGESVCRGWAGMPRNPKGFNVGKLLTIFTRCITNATRSEEEVLFATERLERY